MMEGNYVRDGELYFDIDLIAADGLELPVIAMLDTGFTELLAVNAQDLEALDWRYLRERQLRTAQGIAIFKIYVGIRA
ncbi:hypothetical protein [Iningainema tapete]|uniref:hypothetical protein n=1 Tax=Iningainema tapete TaxID=2806730 RepID=UPI0030810AE4